MVKAVKKELGLSDDLSELDHIGKRLDGIRLTKLEIGKWADEIAKLGGKVRYYTEEKKMVEHFNKRNCGAAFSPRTKPPTIWIRKEATDLELFHEAMHFEDFLRRGQTNYLRGLKEEVTLPFANKTIPKRDQLISDYIKEKYVLDKILEEQALWIKKFGKGRWLEEDIEFSIKYFKKYENKCIKAGIDITKITIKQ